MSNCVSLCHDQCLYSLAGWPGKCHPAVCGIHVVIFSAAVNVTSLLKLPDNKMLLILPVGTIFGDLDLQVHKKVKLKVSFFFPLLSSDLIDFKICLVFRCIDKIMHKMCFAILLCFVLKGLTGMCGIVKKNLMLVASSDAVFFKARSLKLCWVITSIEVCTSTFILFLMTWTHFFFMSHKNENRFKQNYIFFPGPGFECELTGHLFLPI